MNADDFVKVDGIERFVWELDERCAKYADNGERIEATAEIATRSLRAARAEGWPDRAALLRMKFSNTPFAVQVFRRPSIALGDDQLAELYLAELLMECRRRRKILTAGEVIAPERAGWDQRIPGQLGPVIGGGRAL